METTTEEQPIDPVFDTRERIRRLEEQVKRVADGIDRMNQRQAGLTQHSLSLLLLWKKVFAFINAEIHKIYMDDV